MRHPRTCLALAVAALAAFAALTPAGAAKPLSVSPQACVSASAQAAAVVAVSWKRFLPYVKTCAVKDGQGRLLVQILAVDVDAFYSKQTVREPLLAIPRPLLLDNRFATIGSLGANYPSDGPADTVVRFSHFVRGWPTLVTITVSSVSVAGDKVLPPLHWLTDKRIYR